LPTITGLLEARTPRVSTFDQWLKDDSAEWLDFSRQQQRKEPIMNKTQKVITVTAMIAFLAVGTLSYTRIQEAHPFGKFQEFTEEHTDPVEYPPPNDPDQRPYYRIKHPGETAVWSADYKKVVGWHYTITRSKYVEGPAVGFYLRLPERYEKPTIEHPLTALIVIGALYAGAIALTKQNK
jgi:hypothetical protein